MRLWCRFVVQERQFAGKQRVPEREQLVARKIKLAVAAGRRRTRTSSSRRRPTVTSSMSSTTSACLARLPIQAHALIAAADEVCPYLDAAHGSIELAFSPVGPERLDSEPARRA
jgi:organic hydroperoxide reductase OsmC/OhrA